MLKEKGLYTVVTFPNTTAALAMEAACKAQAIPGSIIPVPNQITAGCGFACADYDTMQISRALFPAQRHHRLADLIVRFGIADNEEHRALSDAIQTQQCFEWMRHYVTEHHETEAIRWKQAPAKNSAEILHQQLVVKR